MSGQGLSTAPAAAHLRGMKRPAIVFAHTEFTVHAERAGELWHGELIGHDGQVRDCFAYTRETFPGAVIGALRVSALSFVTTLAARMWLHTGAAEG